MKSGSFKQRLINETTGVYGGHGRVINCGGRGHGLLDDFNQKSQAVTPLKTKTIVIRHKTPLLNSVKTLKKDCKKAERGWKYKRKVQSHNRLFSHCNCKEE